jgi:starch synthase
LQRFGFDPYPLPRGVSIPFEGENLSFDVRAATLPGSNVRVFLIGADRFFDRDGIYLDSVTGRDYPDQADRWIFFQRAAMEFIQTALPRVDVVHCHDHQTALIPAYLDRLYRGSSLAAARTVFTIHNMGYQGLFPKDVMARTGFAGSDFYATGPFEFFGMFNFMKVGVVTADVVTTVSETYAREICENDEFGFGLEGVLRSRAERPIGILNGIDYAIWNPETDPLIPAHYGMDSLAGKRDNKKALLRAFGLDDSRLKNRRPERFRPRNEHPGSSPLARSVFRAAGNGESRNRKISGHHYFAACRAGRRPLRL